MKDESLLLPNRRIGDEYGEEPGRPTDAEASRRAARPVTREEVLPRLSPVKQAVYACVRECVDELEQVAPWELLYYPPENREALLAMNGGLVVAIREGPERIDRLLAGLPAESAPGGPTGDEISFLFHGIHRMVAHDLKRLGSSLETIRNRGPAAPTLLADGQRLCELAADLKGKYASSLMGAAASVLGEGEGVGVELEPILFPEKAEEFRCTRELVGALREAVTAIRQLPGQLPFAEIVERWRQGRRIDQYALADLPSLRGKIGQLLKERSRRALYSGDYHQISRREVLLSARINELERLHQQTWAVYSPGGPPDLSPVFARLVELALEVAAVLDVNILKGILGEKKVNGLRGRAAAVAGKTPPPAGPGVGQGGEGAGQEPLVPLLAEDDLRIFFEMLLTAVQRRASLTVRETVEPPVPVPPARQAPKPQPVVAPPPLSSPSPRIAPAGPVPAAVRPAAPVRREPAVDPRVVLARIHTLLLDLQAPTNAHWSSFRMTQRLLEKHSRIPVAMFHAVNPFLQDVLYRLVPDLQRIVPCQGITEEAVARLETVCRELCEGDPEPAQFVDEVPRKLERILRFLEALRSIAQPSA
jgi:hypothetical protein